MGLVHSPSIVTDGLVLALDAGSPKNYNVGVSTNWTDKVGGNNGTLVGGTYHNDGPFVGAGYVEFDGTDDYLTISNASALSGFSGDFTIEFWFKGDNQTGYAVFLESYNSSPSSGQKWAIQAEGGGTTNMIWVRDGSVKFTTSGIDALDDAWHHHAVVRDGSTITYYIDGVSRGSESHSGTLSACTDFIIGTYSQGTSAYEIEGYLSNVRIVDGTAVYTSNFTVPTKSLTAVPNTVLLTCQGNTISDASSSGHTLTANGDISLTKEPFAGAGAVEFDGSGDYLTTANHASDFNFGSSDFTMEFWINSTKTGRIDPIGWNYNHMNAGWGGMILNYLGSGNMAWYENNNSRISGSSSWNDGSWHHIAVTRDGNSVRMFLDGTQVGSTYTTSHSYGAASSGLMIGVLASITSTGPMDGYISNFRVIKGTALYTSNFTAPTRKLDPIENTVLLTCQGQNIKDNSSSAHTITSNGNVKPTIVSSAFEFDGTNDYVNFGSVSDANFGTGDFAVECWFFDDGSTPDYGGLVVNGQSGGNDNSAFQFGKGGNAGGEGHTGRIEFTRGTSSDANTLYDSTNTIQSNTWTHAIATRIGTTVKLYINGVEVDSMTDSGSYSNTALRVGVNRGGSTYWSGGISNVRIYKGKGLTASEVLQNYNATKGRYGY